MTRFKIKKFYLVPTLHLCVLYGSQNKQQLLPYKTLRDFFITEVESLYSAVRTDSLNKTDTSRLQRVKDGFRTPVHVISALRYPVFLYLYFI
jgi:hypothetical protein